MFVEQATPLDFGAGAGNNILELNNIPAQQII
jgi:hypothetical protein